MPAVTQQGNALKRYAGLIISIAVLIIFFIALTFYNLRVSTHAEEDQARINAAETLNHYSREIIRDIFDAKLSYGEDTQSPHMSALLKRLRQNQEDYSKTLAILKSGGTYTMPGGNTVNIESNADSEITESIKTIENYWNPLQQRIKDYIAIADDIMVDSNDQLDAALTQAKISNLNLVQQGNNIISNVQTEINKESALNKKVQYGAIAFGIIYFVLLLFVFVRQLLKADTQAAEARRETDEIMSTVQEGLFLIDNNLQIGSQQSKALADILPVVDVTNHSFDEVLAKLIDKEGLEDTRSYIRQVFKPRVKESLIKSLNPLDRVQVYLDDGSGQMQERFLKFDFHRVYDGEEIKHILVSVANITQSVELERRLEREREQNNRQVEMLVKVLRIDHSLMESYLRRGDEVSGRINDILRHPDKSKMSLRKKTEAIFREIHGFKGESSALEFDQFVGICEEMEDKLKTLRDKKEIYGDDFLSIAVSLDALIEQLNTLKTLLKRLQTHAAGSAIETNKEALSDAANYIHGAIDDYLSQYALKAAERNYKLVDVLIEGFDKAPFNPRQMDVMKSIAVQMIRNAVVHGIETPEARKAAGKSRQGHLGVSLVKRDGYYDMIIEDDGKGIDTEAVREKLRNLPNFAQDPDKMTEEQLQRAIFVSGISTAAVSNEDAGRGVGMDVVKERIRTLGGKLSIRSKPGVFTRFVVRLQAPNKE